MSPATKPATSVAPVEPTTQKNDLSVLMERMAKLEKDNEILRLAADQQRLERFTPKEAQLPQVSISLYREKLSDKPRVVVGWGKMRNNYVRTTDKTGIEEDQVVDITLEDGEEVILTYKDSLEALEKVFVPVIGTETKFGQITYTVQYNDTEYKMGLAFLNR